MVLVHLETEIIGANSEADNPPSYFLALSLQEQQDGIESVASVNTNLARQLNAVT